jgi:hypothetical protein
VAKGDGLALGAEHPRRETLLQMGEVVPGERFEQPDLGPRRHDRDDVEQRPRAAREPRRAREHGVPHAVRHAVAARGERLRHVEGIAGRSREELGGVGAVRLRERRDGLERERLEVDPRHGVARQLAEREAKRIVPLEAVVSVRDDDERPHGRDAAREQADQVERRLVGPVEVLEDHDARRTAAELVQERRQCVAGAGALVDECRELPAGLGRHVEQRPERTRRVQRFARAREHAHAGDVRAEGADEGGLADPGLASDEHEVSGARARHPGERLVQRVEALGALEQLLPSW